MVGLVILLFRFSLKADGSLTIIQNVSPGLTSFGLFPKFLSVSTFYTRYWPNLTFTPIRQGKNLREAGCTTLGNAKNPRDICWQTSKHEFKCARTVLAKEATGWAARLPPAPLFWPQNSPGGGGADGYCACSRLCLRSVEPALPALTRRCARAFKFEIKSLSTDVGRVCSIS